MVHITTEGILSTHDEASVRRSGVAALCRGGSEKPVTAKVQLKTFQADPFDGNDDSNLPTRMYATFELPVLRTRIRHY